jgi:hypothetical protein
LEADKAENAGRERVKAKARGNGTAKGKALTRRLFVGAKAPTPW